MTSESYEQRPQVIGLVLVSMGPRSSKRARSVGRFNDVSMIWRKERPVLPGAKEAGKRPDGSLASALPK